MARQRANSEGSVFFDKARNRYRAMIIVSGKRKSLGDFRTKEEAKRALRDGTKAKEDGTLVLGPKQSLAQFLAQWLENSAKPSVRARTFESYETIVRVHIVPRLGKVRLSEVRPQHVQQLQNELLAEGKSPRTVLTVRNVLGGALDRAEKWSYIARNPVPLVDAPRVRSDERDPITPEQAMLLLESVADDRLEALYTVALALGLRRGEALGLLWSDVDLDEGVLHVRRALQRLRDGGLQLLELKTRKSRRDVALPETAIRALQVHRERQKFEKKAAGERWQERGLVFTSTIGTPLEPRNVTRSFQQALKRAGLPHQRFHDLRHACATLLLLQGEELKVVQEVLGHSSYNTTANIYAHVLPKLKRQAAARMDAVLTRESA